MQENEQRRLLRNSFFYSPNNELKSFKDSNSFLSDFFSNFDIQNHSFNILQQTLNAYIIEIEHIIEDREKMELPFN